MSAVEHFFYDHPVFIEQTIKMAAVALLRQER
jgi:hypothetical protein